MSSGFGCAWKKRKKKIVANGDAILLKCCLFLRSSSNKNYTKIKEKGGRTQGQLKNNMGQLLSNSPMQSIAIFLVPPPSIQEGWCPVLVKEKVRVIA